MKTVCVCAQVSGSTRTDSVHQVTRTINMVHQGSGSCTPPAHKRLYFMCAICTFVEVSTPFKFNKISGFWSSGMPSLSRFLEFHVIGIDCRDKQLLCSGPSMCPSPSKGPDRVVYVDRGFRRCLWRYWCRSRLPDSPDSTAGCRK